MKNSLFSQNIFSTFADPFGSVVQLDRMTVSGTVGWGFESLRGHLFKSADNELIVSRINDLLNEATQLATHRSNTIVSDYVPRHVVPNIQSVD